MECSTTVFIIKYILLQAIRKEENAYSTHLNVNTNFKVVFIYILCETLLVNNFSKYSADFINIVVTVSLWYLSLIHIY